MSIDLASKEPFIFPSHPKLQHLLPHEWTRCTGIDSDYERHNKEDVYRQMTTGKFYTSHPQTGEFVKMHLPGFRTLDKPPPRKAVVFGGLERWKCLEGYPDYIISTYGRVANHKTMISLQAISHNGYMYVRPYNKSKIGPYRLAVHSLVMKTFGPSRPSADHTINHLNSIRSDNWPSNFEWASQGRQVRHAQENASKRWCDLEILVSNIDNGHLFQMYESVSQAARVYQVSQQVMSERCRHDVVVDNERFSYFMGYTSLMHACEVLSDEEIKTEVWKYIDPKHTGGRSGYQISTIGRLKGLDGRLNKPQRMLDGYIHYRFSHKDSDTTKRAHRLVALTFLPPPPRGKYVVDHIDENKYNNRLSNLQWLTHRQNTQKSIARPIVQLSSEGQVVKKWSCAGEVKRLTTDDNFNIYQACRRQAIDRYGHKWMFENEYNALKQKSAQHTQPAQPTTSNPSTSTTTTIAATPSSTLQTSTNHKRPRPVEAAPIYENEDEVHAAKRARIPTTSTQPPSLDPHKAPAHWPSAFQFAPLLR